MPDHARAQLSLTLVEAAVGATFILAVAMGFALGVPAPDERGPQLDLYAEDAATVLAGEPPRHGGATRLSEIVASEAAFDREREALNRRIDRIVPDNLMYRVETPHGSVGFRRPAGADVGVATVRTVHGEVTIWVWFA